MLKVHTLTLGPLQTNVYITHDTGSQKCCVIDPGYEPQVILDKLQELGLEPEAILLTHGHFDHVGSVRELAAETLCNVYLHPDDLSMPPMMTAGPLYYTHTYGEGDTLELAGLTFHVIHTPGHTPGSVCLLTENTMFCGDTLFARGCGRTDLPGGSYKQLRQSLLRIADMEGNFFIYPGHGAATTLRDEKRYNPCLRG